MRQPELLPKDLPSPPTYRKVNPADFPIMIYAVHSDAVPEYRLDDYANTVLGAAAVDGAGCRAGLDLRPEAVCRARAGQPGGARRARHRSRGRAQRARRTRRSIFRRARSKAPHEVVAIETNDQLFDADGIRKPHRRLSQRRTGAPQGRRRCRSTRCRTPASAPGSTITPAEGIAIQKAPGANTIALVDTIKALMPKLQQSIPPSVHVDLMLDRTLVTRAAVRDVQFTMLLTIALVVIVIFVFLRTIWATVIPSLAVPLSLLATFSVM